MRKPYFPGLNTLRLFAALSVVLGHAADSVAPYKAGSLSHAVVNVFIFGGYDAVSLFFVLSGFLITYLLLVERAETGTISLKDFFIRRTLRIWPVYFLVIALTVVASPLLQVPGPTTFLALFLFSPHVVQTQYLGGFSHFWSIGVEEWFYFAWPFLMKRFRLTHLIVAVIVARLFIAGVLVPQLLITGDRYGDPLNVFLSETRFDAMAMGALGAYLLFHQHWTLRIFYRMQILFFAFFGLTILVSSRGGILFDMIYEFLFMGLILNVSTNPRPLLNLERNVFKQLGRVTYGIYMYQGLTIETVAVFVARLGQTGLVGDAMFYTLVIALTLIVSLISYQYFELPFLRMKPSTIKETSPLKAA